MAHSAETYKVVFSGKTFEGYDPKAVTNRFSLAFNISDKDSLQQIFSGKIIILKRGLDYMAAQRYNRVLSKLGADCCLEREQPSQLLYSEPNQKYERKKRRRTSQFGHNDYSMVGIAPK
jgi:hypothetical protein